LEAASLDGIKTSDEIAGSVPNSLVTSLSAVGRGYFRNASDSSPTTGFRGVSRTVGAIARFVSSGSPAPSFVTGNGGTKTLFRQDANDDVYIA
jgi:hypothetical protein